MEDKKQDVKTGENKPGITEEKKKEAEKLLSIKEKQLKDGKTIIK
jgi:hypothetical protein